MCMEVDRSMACQKNYDEKDYCWHPCACYIDTKYRPKLLSHPEIFEFQDVIKIKNKTIIFS